MDPAEFYDRIMESRRRSVEQVHSLLEGTTDEYDNVHQILDNFAWEVKGIVQRMLKEDNE